MRKKLILIIAAAFVAILGLAVLAWHIAGARYERADVRLFIERMPADSVYALFRDSLGEDYASNLRVTCKIMGADLEDVRGSYVVARGDRVWQVARKLAKHRESPIRLTFNNIRLYDELLDKVSARFAFSADSLRNAADSVLKAEGYAPEEYPAAFLPDTYLFYWTDSPHRVIAALTGETRKFWTEQRRQKAQKLGLTPVQVATLASIVEEETAAVDERPTVARLYINRLQQGMKLQADPTVKFAIGNFSLRRIYGDMLKTDSPYNTYLYAGLPPGPIRIPERATLDAVLDAPVHPWIYMCARPDFSGRHNFADNYGQHLKNAAEYRHQLDKRNIH